MDWLLEETSVHLTKDCGLDRCTEHRCYATWWSGHALATAQDSTQSVSSTLADCHRRYQNSIPRMFGRVVQA